MNKTYIVKYKNWLLKYYSIHFFKNRYNFMNTYFSEHQKQQNWIIKIKTINEEIFKFWKRLNKSICNIVADSNWAILREEYNKYEQNILNFILYTK